MSYQLKNKSKFYSQDWLLRLQIDQAKAQEEYFKYYPELHPDPAIAKKAAQKVKKGDHNIALFTIYCAMDDNISQLALKQYKHDIDFITTYEKTRPLQTIQLDDLYTVIGIYLNNYDSQNNLHGLALFNGLTPEQQVSFIQTHSSLSHFSNAMLALHSNNDVASILSERIVKSKDVNLIELLEYNHHKGLITVSKDDMVDTFVQDFLNGKESSMKLPLIKKNAKKLQEALEAKSTIFSKLGERWGHHGARYALNIFAKKDLTSAKAMLSRIQDITDPAAIRELGETLLLTPEAAHLRQHIYVTAFRQDTDHYSQSRHGRFSGYAIAHNQVRSFAHLFGMIAQKYPDEWLRLCQTIATDKYYAIIHKERNAIIKETLLKEYWYSRRNETREDDWRKRQAFEPYFASAMLLAHVAYGAPLYDAKVPLMHNMDIALSERVLDLKEFSNLKNHIPMLKELYPDSNSAELGVHLWESLSGISMDTHQEIEILLDF